MAARKTITPGSRFGRLTAIEELPQPKPENGTYKHRKILCLCDCGTYKAVLAPSLRSGNTKSCGCLHAESVRKTPRTHGHTVGRVGSPEYRSWVAMLSRCYNQNRLGYPMYGGRGISVCHRWKCSFEAFLSDMGNRPQGTTLDRIDPDGDYTPENCRWATPLEQARNQRRTKRITFNGRTQTVPEWEAELGLSRYTIYDRIKRGYDAERILKVD